MARYLGSRCCLQLQKQRRNVTVLNNSFNCVVNRASLMLKSTKDIVQLWRVHVLVDSLHTGGTTTVLVFHKLSRPVKST